MKITVRVENKTFDIEVRDIHTRPIVATVDGETFEVWPADAGASADAEFRQSSDAASILGKAASRPAVDKARTVNAPIPGVVISIAVKEGDKVSFGNKLCIIEAMKMMNVIRAARDGQIAAVRVSVGDHVNHGQVLVEYSD
jgi:biotin carboxyl carrier protein